MTAVKIRENIYTEYTVTYTQHNIYIYNAGFFTEAILVMKKTETEILPLYPGDTNSGQKAGLHQDKKPVHRIYLP